MLSEQAYQTLKLKLADLKSGTYLSARQFANDINMGYTPVREAFLRLHREGVLKQVPNVGFFINYVDLADIFQSYEIRECIEPFVLEKAFDRITKDNIEEMRTIVENQYMALSARKIKEYLHLDIEFHLSIFGFYNSKHLSNLYKNIREQYMFCSNKIAIDLDEITIREHKLLVDAIEASDLDKSLDILNKHITAAKERIKAGYISVVE